MLEPYDGKLSRTVLRGEGDREVSDLPGPNKTEQIAIAAVESERTMRIYLDNCAFNRPLDDQRHIRVRLESEAKLYLQDRIKEGKTELVWSYILDIENDQNPFEEKRNAIAKWKRLAVIDVEETDSLKERADSLVTTGIKAKDALHVSAAIEGNASFFVTTDDRLLKKLFGITEIRAVNSIFIAGEIDDNDN